VRPPGLVVAAFVTILLAAPAVAQKPGSADSGKPSAKAAAQAEEAFKKAEAFGEKNNLVEALRWYRVAADQGHLESQNNVGMFYVSGMGVKKDVVEGARWLRKAADRGHDVAQRNLGFLYLQGIGVAQDRAEAIRWLRKAADQGDEEAKSVLKRLGR
jgi:TPR repeat protein